MDPDATLHRIRTKLDEFESLSDLHEVHPALTACAAQLVELVHGLDGWLSRAGYLPAAWSPTDPGHNLAGVGVEVVPDGDCYAVAIERRPARSASWSLREDAERLAAIVRQIPVTAVESGFDLPSFVGDLIRMLNTQNVLARLRSMS